MKIKLKNSRLLKNLLSDVCGQPLRWIRASWQVENVETHPAALGLLESKTPVIYALWHGRMYSLFKAVPLDKTAILVSPSNDGEFITRLARCIGFRHFVRGSHKRGGTQAILGLHRALTEQGHSVAFTVDGPRGPRYAVKPGIIRLAAQTGAPIIPLGSATRHMLWKLDDSWDHFHAPMPFTQVSLRYGEPLIISQNPDDEAIQNAMRELENELFRINRDADAFYGFTQDERL